MAQPEYSHLKPLEVPLLVVANLLLQPAEVYLTQGDTIFLQVLQVRKGRIHKVDLRHGQYYLEAEDDEIIKLDNALGNMIQLSIAEYYNYIILLDLFIFILLYVKYYLMLIICLIVTGVKYGESKVFVKDHNSKIMDETIGVDIPKLPEGKVIVTHPDKIRLTLQPYDNWITIVGKKYIITAELYTR